MKQQVSYQRVFTGLDGLQADKTVTYALTEALDEGVPQYGIQVTEVGSGCFKSELIPPFTEEREWAENVLKLLAENAVQRVHCRAVINDVCTAYDGIGWSDDGERTGSASHCG